MPVACTHKTDLRSSVTEILLPHEIIKRQIPVPDRYIMKGIPIQLLDIIIGYPQPNTEKEQELQQRLA